MIITITFLSFQSGNSSSKALISMQAPDKVCAPKSYKNYKKNKDKQ